MLEFRLLGPPLEAQLMQSLLPVKVQTDKAASRCISSATQHILPLQLLLKELYLWPVPRAMAMSDRLLDCPTTPARHSPNPAMACN